MSNDRSIAVSEALSAIISELARTHQADDPEKLAALAIDQLRIEFPDLSNQELDRPG